MHFNCNFVLITWFCLLDVIGVLTAVGKEREYVKDGVSSKINVIELDNNG